MYQRIVVKLGTSVLTGGTPRLDRSHMVELARQCAQLYREGKDIIIVTSAAIAAGRERLGYPDLPRTITSKQMLAAAGQSRLMHVWEQLFDIYDINVAQILLTRADVHSRTRYLNARDTLQALLQQRLIPIINENDAAATDEIKLGDNDNLSALVAMLVGADLLLLLTDQPGLFTADPRTHPEAELIREVKQIDESLHRLAGGSVSGLGVGGMRTKLQAADVARRAGVEVVIAAGRAPNIIYRLVQGEDLGTKFLALETPLESRKQWVLAGRKTAGRLIVDAGAAQALVERGRSLLPAGILQVEGVFERGDTVSIVRQGVSEGDLIEVARGIARYPSAELTQIAGCHSGEIEERLGYNEGPVAVHRNDLILL